MVLKNFGERLREHIKTSGRTQADAARECGIGESHMTRILNGEKDISLMTLHRLWVHLEFSIEDLLADEE